MRLLSLEVTGFRGFASRQVFDLDADAVVVIGANGNGKTSLFDAVLWAITGNIPRLGSDDSLLVCRFSETGLAKVVVRLGDAGGVSPLTITRIFDGSRTTISVETPEGLLRGAEAEARLVQRVWKEADTASSPSEALATALTRCVYLQQDLVRDFIGSVTPQERFSAVSELIGAGRVTDLQEELERAKKAWSSATNSRVAELMAIRSRLSTMESRVAELEGRTILIEDSLDEVQWQKWWEHLQDMDLAVAPVSPSSREAAGSIDGAITQIDAARRAAERTLPLLESLKQELTTLAVKPRIDLAPLRSMFTEKQQQVDETRRQVSVEQQRASDLRRVQIELRETSEQLRALAAIALKHLGDKCPVCAQDYDLAETRQRMERLAMEGLSAEDQADVSDPLTALLASLASKEKELSLAELQLRTAEQTIRGFEVAEQVMDRRLADLGVETGAEVNRLSLVDALVTTTKGRIDDLVSAQRTGETFALKLSQAGDQATLSELQREVATTKAKLALEDVELSQRAATGEQAQDVIEALREAASRVVTQRVQEMEPLLSDLYSRIDVHPAFRVVRFLASVVRGRGQLTAVVSDPLSEVESDSPATVLSSAQMNALAVCTFLALNLGLSSLPLDAAILDDPLQSLDDINLLGLIDLLRRTKDERQLIISTHDMRFGNLLARKLRPGSQEQRTVVIELEGWKRTGPTVAARDIQADPTQIRLVSSESAA